MKKRWSKSLEEQVKIHEEWVDSDDEEDTTPGHSSYYDPNSDDSSFDPGLSDLSSCYDSSLDDSNDESEKREIGES